jgi:deoxyribonuclease V
MKFPMESEHDWNLTPKQAIALQNELRDRVSKVDEVGTVRRVAGVDVGFEANKTITRAAVAVLSFPKLELVEHAIARVPTSFPYVPGLLSFRELPAVLRAFEQLNIQPDLCLVDGHGYAHPRRFGIACHLGVLTGIPTIGVAKSRLIGECDEVSKQRGAWQPLRHKDETIGAVLRSKTNTNPLYISIGHRISLKSAIDWVLACTTRYRLPETTRHAHRLASGPPK